MEPKYDNRLGTSQRSRGDRENIQTYLNGGISGKSDDMKTRLPRSATIYGYIGPDLFGGPIQGLFDGMTATARLRT